MSGVALVTGASRRIGAAIALEAAAMGHAVAVHARAGDAEATALAQRISAAGGTAQVFAANLEDRKAAAELVAQVHAALGPLTLLVNNASLFEPDGAQDFTAAGWDAHMAVNLESPLVLSREMANALPDGVAGNIVNLIDQRVWRLNPHFFTYTLSKSALWTATRTMALAFAPRVRVNAIGPGPTLPSPRQSAEDFVRQTETLLLEHGPALDEFGATIRYLWQNSSITGQMIALDGGQHLAWRTPDVDGIAE